MRTITLSHRAGKVNLNADALSRDPHSSPPVNEIGECEVQVAVITNDTTALTPASGSEMNIMDMLNLQ